MISRIARAVRKRLLMGAARSASHRLIGALIAYKLIDRRATVRFPRELTPVSVPRTTTAGSPVANVDLLRERFHVRQTALDLTDALEGDRLPERSLQRIETVA